MTFRRAIEFGVVVVWAGIVLAGPVGHAQVPQRSVLLVYSGERTVSGLSAVRNASGPDLIFVMGDVAYSFVSRYRATFFPETPIVFSTADPVRAVSNSTGILTPVNIKATLDVALSIDPRIAHVAVVAGASPYDRYYEATARDQFRPFESRVTFTYLTGLAMRDLLQRVTLDALSAAATAPIFSWNALGLDHGAVRSAGCSLRCSGATEIATKRRRFIAGPGSNSR